MIFLVLQVGHCQALTIAMVLVLVFVVSIPCLVEIHRHHQVDLRLPLAADICSVVFLDGIHQPRLGGHRPPLGAVNPKFILAYLEVIRLHLHAGPRQRLEDVLAHTMLGQQMRWTCWFLFAEVVSNW